MSRLPESFLDDLRARVPIADVIGRRVALKRKGRTLVGLCCFHAEKTPSLTVYPDDPHFKCFGCGQHGDVISFVMQAERKEFREAVEQLAKEAGLEVPTTPEQRAEDDRRGAILEQIRLADLHYQDALYTQGGKAALGYLLARGLTLETIKAAGLGQADGQAWRGYNADLAHSAGLLMQAPSKASLHPLLFRRITFPIWDRRGRTVAFTARTLADNIQPKYLNTYNSELFEKGKALYVTPRRMIEGDDVYLVEGPLDALALYQAGVCSAALMSSSLSADHLAEVWRAGATPILCLDGDAPGRRASLRALSVALPLLTPHKTLRVVLLPHGEDPDSLLRGRSTDEALEIMRAATLPVERALYELLRPSAALDAACRAQHLEEVLQHLKAVMHGDLRSHLVRAVRDMHYQHRAAAAPVRALVNGEAEAARAMTAVVLRNPWIVSHVAVEWERVQLPSPLAAVRGSALAVYADDPRWPDDFIAAVERRAPGLVTPVLADEPLPLPPFARSGVPEAEAEAGFWACYARLSQRKIAEEIEEARAAFRENPSPLRERRLVALTVASLKGGQ